MAKLVDDLPRGEAALARCARLEHLATGLRGQASSDPACHGLSADGVAASADGLSIEGTIPMM